MSNTDRGVFLELRRLEREPKLSWTHSLRIWITVSVVGWALIYAAAVTAWPYINGVM